MTRDDIIRMAREAGLQWTPAYSMELERFAALVAAAEARHQQETLMLQKASYEREIEIDVEAERQAILNILDEHCRSVDVREAVEIIKARANT